MADSRAVSILYLLELVGCPILKLSGSPLILKLLGCPLTAGVSRMAHSYGGSGLYLLELVGWLILELLVSCTCWS